MSVIQKKKKSPPKEKFIRNIKDFLLHLILRRSCLIDVGIQTCFRSGKMRWNLLLNVFNSLWNIITSWNIFDSSITNFCFFARNMFLAMMCNVLGLAIILFFSFWLQVCFFHGSQWCFTIMPFLVLWSITF